MVNLPYHWLKERLKTRLATVDRPEHLPWVLLFMNMIPRDDRGKTDAEMVYGVTLILPSQIGACKEPPVYDILHTLHRAEPILTRHRHKEAPSRPPSQLTMVYLGKGGQLPLLA